MKARKKEKLIIYQINCKKKESSEQNLIIIINKQVYERKKRRKSQKLCDIFFLRGILYMRLSRHLLTLLIIIIIF
jgi:hypothetical protein